MEGQGRQPIVQAEQGSQKVQCRDEVCRGNQATSVSAKSNITGIWKGSSVELTSSRVVAAEASRSGSSCSGQTNDLHGRGTTLLQNGKEIFVGELSLKDVKNPQDKWHMSTTPYIFLSHTGRDGAKKDIIRPTYWFLTEVLKVRAFLDEQNALTGVHKVLALMEPAYTCTHALLILSPSFRTREFCVLELNTFMGRLRRQGKIRVLPALWLMDNLDGYDSKVDDLIRFVNADTRDSVHYMVQFLWPALVEELGLPEMSTKDMKAHLYRYVEEHRGEQHDIPTDLERFARRKRELDDDDDSGDLKVRQMTALLSSDWRKQLPESTLQYPNPRKLWGREEQLTSLRKMFDRDYPVIVAITGEAGIGKTHLAEAFVREWVKENEEQRCGFWLQSETETTLRRDYERALKKVYRLSDMAQLSKDREYKTVSDLADELWSALAELSDSFDWFHCSQQCPRECTRQTRV